MGEQPLGEYVLGIDLGTNSLGWAIVGLVDGEPAKLVQAGVRVFEAGMEGDIESGREESRNLKRRQMRLQRRQAWRRARRLKKILNMLQRFGLLPPAVAAMSPSADGGQRPPLQDSTVEAAFRHALAKLDERRPPATPEDRRQNLLSALDQALLASPWFAAKEKSGLCPEPRQVMPYILRAAALDERLEPYFLGRALYHLAQRRGFLSGRLRPTKKDDDEGVVKEGIGELRRKMQEANSRTLGEYFSQLKPSEERIRSRWTARDMYEKEFDAIWAAQSTHHPAILTEERRKELFKAIFFQRPLWFDPNTIGTCELEPDCRRAPAYLPVAQRFRLLQTVNNLRLLPPDEPETPLTPADRKKLIDDLELKGDLKFDKIRKLLGLEKEYLFSLERGGEKTIKGNRTNSEFYKVFGERWLKMTPEERDRAVEYVHAFQKPGKLKEAAMKKFGLDEAAAEKLAEISLEPEYMNHSRRAIEKLLPLLELGATYAEARKAVYPQSFQSGEPKPLLPPVEKALEIRNPAVTRSLTELRKVVNAVVRQYGKPQEIRIELARDLKKSKRQRQANSDANRENQNARANAAKKILAREGVVSPTPTQIDQVLKSRPGDVRKVQLADECRWECPYTAKSISMEALLGPEPQFDIEHIIPFSRSMDNSFLNLTLCYVPENRSVKGNKTPHQAYSGDSQKYEDIKDRVKKFAGERRTVSEKLKRFLMNDDELETFLSDFRDRQLNDTAYASKLAKQYLGILYGGDVDSENKRRVQATSGQSTAYFRNLWKLNAILNDGPTTDGGYKPKSRDDHRHHAVDAVVISLTDAGMIKRLSDAAQRAPLEGRKRFASLKGPWENFVDSVRAEIGKITVSHRVSKKVSGALHEETVYSRPFPVAAVSDRRPRSRKNGGEDTAATAVRVRKPLASLTKPELEQIADEGVKKLVLKKLEELGGGEPKKAFSNQANLPKFPQSGVLIKRVRINKATPIFVLGEGRSARHVTSESTHHIEIFAELDTDGSEVEWDGEVVPMQEAYRRMKAREPVVKKNLRPGRRFKFSLAQGEAIECDGSKSTRRLLVTRSYTQLSAGSIVIGFAPASDARPKKEMQADKSWVWKGPDTLRKLNPRKVVVSPLGEISDACD